MSGVGSLGVKICRESGVSGFGTPGAGVGSFRFGAGGREPGVWGCPYPLRAKGTNARNWRKTLLPIEEGQKFSTKVALRRRGPGVGTGGTSPPQLAGTQGPGDLGELGPRDQGSEEILVVGRGFEPRAAKLRVESSDRSQPPWQTCPLGWQKGQNFLACGASPEILACGARTLPKHKS